MEKKRLRAAVAIALVAIMVGGFYWFRSARTAQSEKPTETATVIKGSLAPTLAVTGAVAADERKVNADTSGRVSELLVKEGDVVAAGQTLLKLDASGANQDLNIAAANLNSAKARLQELKDKSASAAEIASQDAMVAKANADYQNAADAQEAVTIISPIAGTVIDITVAVGDQVSGQSGGSASTAGGAAEAKGLVTVADLGKLHIEAAIDQADVSKVAVGQATTVSLDALPGKNFKGSVTHIDAVPVTEQNVVTYTAYVSLEGLDPGARLGMSADITVDLGKKEGVLIVPNIAVHSRGENKTVTKIVDGEATDVTVETGVADSKHTEITSGLSAGDKIVLQSFTSTAGTAGNTVFGSGGQRRGGFAGPGMGMGR